jgi:hypothetical protein
MKKAIVILSILAVASSVMAQRMQMQFGGGQMAASMLVYRQDVQKELKITPDQVTKLRQMRDKFEDERESFMENVRFNGGNEGQANNGGGRQMTMGGPNSEMGKFFADMMARQTKELKEILTEEQHTRLNQIALQQGGMRSLMDTDLQKKLGFTKEQTDKVGELQKKQGEAFQTIFQKMRDGELDRSELQPLMEKNNKIMEAELEKVLSAAQKQKFKELQGAPFKFDENEPFGGRRPGG